MSSGIQLPVRHVNYFHVLQVRSKQLNALYHHQTSIIIVKRNCKRENEANRLKICIMTATDSGFLPYLSVNYTLAPSLCPQPGNNAPEYAVVIVAPYITDGSEKVG